LIDSVLQGYGVLQAEMANKTAGYGTTRVISLNSGFKVNKKHLKNVGPIRHCEPPHALILHCHSPGAATVARRLRIDVHEDDDDNNDNA